MRNEERKARRDRLSEAQNHRCCYCGTRMTDTPEQPHSATLEHVVPRSFGGSNGDENCVVACRACNHRRATKAVAGMPRHLSPFVTVQGPALAVASLREFWPEGRIA